MKDIYYKAMYKAIDRLIAEKDNIKELYKKILFYGVNAINLDSKEPLYIEEARKKFELINLMTRIISELTPREFMQIFPIDKVYDGDKWECKDYFYTMQMIEDHGIDEEIKEPLEFLMDYTNMKVRIFTVKMMGAIDDMREYEGKASMMSEFMEAQGVESHTMYQDQRGNEFMLSKEGKTIKVGKPKKRKPKYLKLVR